jgi:hypothetical protein
MSPYDATRAGLLTGATVEELTSLARLFPRHQPGMAALVGEADQRVFVFRCCKVALDMDLPLW